MNKAAVIGAIAAVIVGIIIVSAVMSTESVDETELALDDVLETEVNEEPEAVEETGRDLSVEFTESIGLQSP